MSDEDILRTANERLARYVDVLVLGQEYFPVVTRKSDRVCNNPGCGVRLTDASPNWFQCTETCRIQVLQRTLDEEAERKRREDAEADYFNDTW